MNAVAVVIPTKDRAHLIEDAVGCVLAQRGVEPEIHVVDDGSRDGTGERLARFGDRIEVHRGPRSEGVARARNRGLAAVRAPWVAFLDDDDLWAPDRLARMRDALRARPDAALASTGSFLVNDAGRVLSRQEAPPPGPLFPALLERNTIPAGGSGVLAPTDRVRALGGFDPELHVFADWDLWIRLAAEGPGVAVEEPLTAYRVHTGGMSATHDGAWGELSRFLAKHAERRAARGVTRPPHDVLLWMIKNRWRSGARLRALAEILGTRSPRLLLHFLGGRVLARTVHPLVDRSRRAAARALVTAWERAARDAAAAARSPSSRGGGGRGAAEEGA